MHCAGLGGFALGQPHIFPCLRRQTLEGLRLAVSAIKRDNPLQQGKKAESAAAELAAGLSLTGHGIDPFLSDATNLAHARKTSVTTGQSARASIVKSA